MHIGIDASRAFLKERTGTEEYSYQLIKALARLDRKNNYTLYVKFSPPVGGFNFQLPKNFQLKVIPFPYLWTQGGLALECLRNPPDVLFIPAHTLPVLRRPGLKTVVTIHDLGAEFLPQYHQFPQKLYLNKTTEYAVRHATYLIAVSQSTRQDLIIKLHCDSQKISVIYEGYDSEIFNPPAGGLKTPHFAKASAFVETSADRSMDRQKSKVKIENVKKKYGISDNYILFVGTVQPRKNLVRLIEAFSFLCHPEPFRHSERSEESQGKLREGSLNDRNSSPLNKLGAQNDIQLIIVGKPGWMCEGIYAAPQKFGVEEKVRFLNYVPKDELALLYQGALCFVLPSLYEGFGLPVLEAMACGCPVVVSKASSLPEVAGEAGVLVDPYDVEDISKNLQFTIYNLQLRGNLIEKGFEQVKKFSWEKCARETLKILEKT